MSQREYDRTFGLVPISSVPASAYEYVAIVNRFYPEVTDPSAVVRRWEFLPGVLLEELFSRDLEWVPTHALADVVERRSEGETVWVDVEAARRFEAVQAERVRTGRQGPRYVYFALLSSSHPDVEDPMCVGRKCDDGYGRVLEEIYSRDCEWVLDWRRSSLADDCPEIDEAAARRFEEIQAERYRGYLPADGRFSYVAIASSPSLDDAKGLVRTWTGESGSPREEDFGARDRRWRSGHSLEAIDRGSDSGYAIPISREVAERLETTLVERARAHEERMSRVYDFYAITDEGPTVDDPLTVVRVWTPETGDPVEEQYGRRGWEATDLLRHVAEHEVARIDETQLHRFQVLHYERAKRSLGTA